MGMKTSNYPTVSTESKSRWTLRFPCSLLHPVEFSSCCTDISMAQNDEIPIEKKGTRIAHSFGDSNERL